VDFQARYLPFDRNEPVIVSLGSITRPPFKLIWNTANVPNQLITGVSFLAEATLETGQVISARKEGVFFTHQPVRIPTFTADYAYKGTNEFTNDTLVIPSETTTHTIKASIFWNETDVVFLIDVKDPSYNATLPANIQNEMGVEILIDPTLSRKPFPTSEVLIFAVPLNGKAYRINYMPVFENDGSFKLISTASAYKYKCKVDKWDYKGYSVVFPVPNGFFGKRAPERFGCNIIIKSLDSKQKVKRTSWIKGNLYDSYSPYIWGEVRLTPKPLLKNRFIQWLLCFTAGLLTAVLLSFAFSVPKRRKIIYKIENSEYDQELFEKIKAGMDFHITSQDLTLDKLARELHMPPGKIHKIIQRQTGLNFRNFLMYSRIEIAKERLRSSHSSEASIADTCGFAGVNEMEKYFNKFLKTTPYKFRLEQQVA